MKELEAWAECIGGKRLALAGLAEVDFFDVGQEAVGPSAGLPSAVTAVRVGRVGAGPSAGGQIAVRGEVQLRAEP